MFPWIQTPVDTNSSIESWQSIKYHKPLNCSSHTELLHVKLSVMPMSIITRAATNCWSVAIKRFSLIMWKSPLEILYFLTMLYFVLKIEGMIQPRIVCCFNALRVSYVYIWNCSLSSKRRIGQHAGCENWI